MSSFDPFSDLPTLNPPEPRITWRRLLSTTGPNVEDFFSGKPSDLLFPRGVSSILRSEKRQGDLYPPGWSARRRSPSPLTPSRIGLLSVCSDMFEDFSFPSPSSRPTRLTVDAEDRLMVDGDSTLISPLSSRCPSPKSHRFRTLSRPRSAYLRYQQQPPTSVPLSCEQKRLSISTLTQKLHEHTLQAPSGERLPERGSLGHDGRRLSNRYSRYVLTPPDTDYDEDGHGDSSPSICTNPSPTHWQPEFSLVGPETSNVSRRQSQALPDHLSIRMQRQQISQLQCNNEELDAIRRTVLSQDAFCPDMSREEDDRHPSSLPSRSSPRRRAVTLHRSRFGPDSSTAETRGRRRSISGAAQTHRIEKNHHPSTLGGRDSKRGEQGLRRKSMVSAALASVVEQY